MSKARKATKAAKSQPRRKAAAAKKTTTAKRTKRTKKTTRPAARKPRFVRNRDGSVDISFGDLNTMLNEYKTAVAAAMETSKNPKLSGIANDIQTLLDDTACQTGMTASFAAY